MSRLHAIHQVSALLLAGLFSVGTSGCGNQATSAEVQDSATPTAATSGQSDTGTVDASAFGYDFANADIAKSVREDYGKAAIDNLFADVFGAMATVRSNDEMYRRGPKGSKVYESLKSHMTPEAWKRNVKQEDSDNEDQDGDVFNAMALTCYEDGTIFALKDGADPSSKNYDDYAKFDCDVPQRLSNTKITDVKVDTYVRNANDKNLVDIPQHVQISAHLDVRYTGQDSSGNQWQVISTDVTFYVAPAKQNNDHWLVDAAGWAYEYGDSSYRSE